MTMITIQGASLLKQHGATVYSFKISAAEFLGRGNVERLSEGNREDAIQRDLIENHALNIAAAMLDPSVLWPDSLVIALSHEPKVKNGQLSLPDVYSFLVDDGQHRLYGLRIIQEMGDKIPDIEFQVFATFGLSVEERVQLFKLQTKRKAVTRDFSLALSDKANSHKNEAEARAYAVVMILAKNSDSPLQSHIALPGRSKQIGQQTCWLSTSVVVTMLRPMFAPKAPWTELSNDEAARALMCYFDELLNMWSNAWRNPDEYVLCGNRAICALITMLTAKRSRIHIRSFRDEAAIRQFARLFSGFKWSKSVRQRNTTRQMENALFTFLEGSIERGQS